MSSAEQGYIELVSTSNFSFLRGGSVGDFFVASFPAYPNYLTVTLKQ